MEAMSEPETRPVPRWFWWAVAVGLAAGAIYLLRGVLTPVFFAFLIAYLLDPLVDRLESWRLPRALAIVVIFVLGVGALALLALLVAPAAVRELGTFARNFPSALQDLVARIQPWLAEHGIPVPHNLPEAVAQIGGDVEALAGRAARPAFAALQWLVGSTATLVGALVAAVIVPIFATYLLYDFDRMVTTVAELIPANARPRTYALFRDIDVALGRFVRGQLTVMAILAVLYGLAYAIVGVPLAALIGLVAGLFSFIPYVGAGLALMLALVMSVLGGQELTRLIWVLVAYGAVQLLEGFVVTPNVMGSKVGLSSIWVLFALMVGAELFGFLGVLLAVPTAAVLKVLVVRAVDGYRRSALFTGETEPPPAADP